MYFIDKEMLVYVQCPRHENVLCFIGNRMLGPPCLYFSNKRCWHMSWARDHRICLCFIGIDGMRNRCCLYFSDKEMLVRVQGPRPENVLFLIHEVIESLVVESFSGVSYDFLIPCPDCIKKTRVSGDHV